MTRASDEFYLTRAYDNAAYSFDESSQIGAVIVREDGYITGHGWNRFPAGVEMTPERWERPLKYEYVVHAEVTSILHSLANSHRPHTMYCNLPACANCAKTMVEAGLRKVVGHQLLADHFAEHNPKWTEQRDLGMSMLAEGGVEIEWYDEPLPEAVTILSGGQKFDPSVRP